jgi:hypothetical protein
MPFAFLVTPTCILNSTGSGLNWIRFPYVHRGRQFFAQRRNRLRHSYHGPIHFRLSSLVETRPVSLSEKWATRQQIWVGDQSAGVGGDPSSSLFRGLVGAGCRGTARVGPSHGGAGVADGVAAAVLPGAGGISLRRGRATRSRPAGTVPVDAGDRAGRTGRLDWLGVVVP